MDSDKLRAMAATALIVLFFILSSYLVQGQFDLLEGTLDAGVTGAVIYVFIVIIAVVIAPVSAAPLIPLAANLWGWALAAVLNITGWTAGALIAFMLARRYGTRLVERLISLEKIAHITQRIPDKNLFWSVVLLRMTLPVDVLSYALGLFSDMPTKTYILATIVGVTPFAFIFSYAGTVDIIYQALAAMLALIVVIAGYRWRRSTR